MKVAIYEGERYPDYFVTESFPSADSDDLFDIDETVWRKYLDALTQYKEIQDLIKEIYEKRNK